jgi:hypothetical protein
MTNFEQLLIDKIEAEKTRAPDNEGDQGYNHGIDSAIAIIRRHYEGRPAVEGKPLELMSRDELLAHIRQHTAARVDTIEQLITSQDQESDRTLAEMIVATMGDYVGGEIIRDAESLTTIEKVQAGSKLNVSLNDISAISAMIGYCQSLERGTVITSDYIDCLNDYYVPNLQKLLDKLMGDASARKDEEVTVAIMPTTTATSPVISSEIPYNKDLRELLISYFGRAGIQPFSAMRYGDSLYEELRPYLRTTEPVSVQPPSSEQPDEYTSLTKATMPIRLTPNNTRD